MFEYHTGIICKTANLCNSRAVYEYPQEKKEFIITWQTHGQTTIIPGLSRFPVKPAHPRKYVQTFFRNKSSRHSFQNAIIQ